MELLHLMATTHPTRVMEATVGSRAHRRPAPVHRRRAHVPTLASRLRVALTGPVASDAEGGVCATC